MTLDNRTGSAARRSKALVTAELRQFFANRTLLFMAALPALMSIGMYFLIGRQSDMAAGLEYTLAEVFIPFVLLFVQFYPVISMATTRRDEKVLKRLRTGEARDHEILGALVVPGAVTSVAIGVVYVAVVLATGSPGIDNPLLLIAVLALGLMVAATCGLLTTAYTKNAEAAQMTSMPVFIIALLALPNLRELYPDDLARLVERTPFALVYDLAHAAWLGNSWEWSELALLVGWVIVLGYCANRYFRWETNR